MSLKSLLIPWLGKARYTFGLAEPLDVQNIPVLISKTPYYENAGVLTAIETLSNWSGGKIIVQAWSTGSSGLSNVTVDSGGINFTRIAQVESSVSGNFIEIWYCDPSDLLTGFTPGDNIDITLTNSSLGIIQFHGYDWSNVPDGNPLILDTKGPTTGTSIGTSFNVPDNSVVIQSFFGSTSNASGTTPGNGQTFTLNSSDGGRTNVHAYKVFETGELSSNFDIDQDSSADQNLITIMLTNTVASIVQSNAAIMAANF